MRRAVFYLFYDPQGQVDDYVLHTLEHLRPHGELLFVVSNSPLDETNRGRLEAVADTVWVRRNVGFDVWAYKESLAQVGADELATYDEVLMVNSTFFGPVGSFDDVFATMDARDDIDFWGMTEHGRQRRHPLMKDRVLEAHVQTHWLAARRRLVTSADWSDYWASMPMIETYHGSIVHHETRFTPHFVDRGYTCAAAFPAKGYGSKHPIMDNPVAMLRDGCPLVKRRCFFYDPIYHEWKGNDGRQLARLMEERGYPMEHAYRNLARTAKPRSLVTNMGWMDVLPEVDLGYDHGAPLRVVAIVHVFYPEMTDEIVDRLDHLPSGYDLVVTTTDDHKRTLIAETLRRRDRPADIRIVKSNRGRDISAFFIDCKDVLESGDYDIVVKVHSKKQPQDNPNVRELFRRHMWENLLSSPGYTANLLRLFQQQPTLGIVVPPVYHIAYPTLGHAWFANKGRAREEAERLGIVVPLDDNTPVSAYGSFFIARPETLSAITAHGYQHDDFPDESDYRDGALTHVVERLVTYAVLNTGHHCRQVMNAEMAAINYSYLEYRAIVLGAKLPSYPRAQIKRISKLKKIRKQAIAAGMFTAGSGGRPVDRLSLRRRIAGRLRS